MNHVTGGVTWAHAGRQLDPALLRRGRLLANPEFARFSPSEARTWLE